MMILVVVTCVAAQVASAPVASPGVEARNPAPARTDAGSHPETPFANEDDPLNLPLKTLGGRQFWSDELILHEYRIQRNVLTGHYRLLDDRDVRRHWGNWQGCRDALAEIQQRVGLSPHQGRVVVLLHGLGRSRHSMRPLARFLQEQEGYEVVNVGYASTRAGIQEHARTLSRVIQHLGPEVTRIDFAAHSLGNLVIRQYLHDAKRAGAEQPLDKRIGRLVMLGPPNQGAAITRYFRDNVLFHAVLGGSSRQLSAGFSEWSKTLGKPPCPFAIIAGGKADGRGWNPLLNGDDDLIVRVEETKLDGASAFLQVPVLHTFLMDDPEVHKFTAEFLQR